MDLGSEGEEASAVVGGEGKVNPSDRLADALPPVVADLALTKLLALCLDVKDAGAAAAEMLLFIVRAAEAAAAPPELVAEEGFRLAPLPESEAETLPAANAGAADELRCFVFRAMAALMAPFNPWNFVCSLLAEIW